MTSRVLRQVAAKELDIAADLEKVAELYQQEVDQSGLWQQHVQQNNEGARRFADPSVRRRLAEQLLRCMEFGEQATVAIETLLARMR